MTESTQNLNDDNVNAAGELDADAIPGNVVGEPQQPEQDTRDRAAEGETTAFDEGDQATEPLSEDPQPGEPS